MILIEWAKMFWLRFVGFPRDDRLRFLRIIQVQQAEGRPEAEIYQSLAEFGHSGAIKAVARMSLTSKRDGLDYTTEWG